ncbi:hypothetical protein [Ramlibacter sp.]|uniref:hypothetical protein n=1 Tax=Ramlibacter sp. TaxID=1917967 RepID=UPI0035B4AE59
MNASTAAADAPCWLLLTPQAQAWQATEIDLAQEEPGLPDAAFVARIPPDALQAFADTLAAIARRAHTADLLILVPHRPPPEVCVREDGAVDSFACRLGTLRALAAHGGWALVQADLYRVTEAALNNPHAPAAACLQMPPPSLDALADAEGDPALTAEWIIPHRGWLPHLRTCLAGVARAAGAGDLVSVALDEPVVETHRALAAQHPGARVLACEPSGVGPYVAREILASQCRHPAILFQDADDSPCVDRRHRLLAALVQRDLDLVGSHELRVDEIKRQVVALRFPLDVTRALDKMPCHPLLFPSAAVRTPALRAAGGLSTHRRFGSDTEFILRAHFFLRIGNVDDFLYLRRMRAGSLTTSPETHVASPMRQALDATWKRDFALVRRGRLALADSSLAVTHREDLRATRLVRVGAQPPSVAPA